MKTLAREVWCIAGIVCCLLTYVLSTACLAGGPTWPNLGVSLEVDGGGSVDYESSGPGQGDVVTYIDSGDTAEWNATWSFTTDSIISAGNDPLGFIDGAISVTNPTAGTLSYTCIVTVPTPFPPGVSVLSVGEATVELVANDTALAQTLGEPLCVTLVNDLSTGFELFAHPTNLFSLNPGRPDSQTDSFAADAPPDPTTSFGFRLRFSLTAGDTLTFTPSIYIGTVATPIFVDASSGGGAGGLTWADAFQDLQDALFVANAFHDVVDEIWVAAGEYRPSATGDQEATFPMVSGVTVYGGFDGTETMLAERDVDANVTVLTGDLNGNDAPNFINYDDNSYTVLSADGTDPTAVMDGMTITGGNSMGMCAGGPNCAGGVLYLNGPGHPTFRTCRFVANRAADFGGAIALDWIDSGIVLEDCRFEGNHALNGGAFLCIGEGVLRRCVFVGNSSDGNASAIERLGGLPSPLFLVESCDFIGNTGGAAFYEMMGGADVVNCRFVGNVSFFEAGAIEGDGTRIAQCTFVGNSTFDDGGAISLFGASASLRNSVVWGNTAMGPGQNVIGDGQISHCNIEGSGGSGGMWDASMGIDGGGNIDDDPDFVDIDGVNDTPGDEDDDVRLDNFSPCLDAGNNADVPAGLTVDLDGNPRLYDDLAVADCWQSPGMCGTPPIVDMGAYERQTESQNVTRFVFVGESIQSAIDGANPGDTIELQPGTYNEAIDLGDKSLVIRSGGADDEYAVIDVTGLGVSAITIIGGQGAETVVEGLVFTGADLAGNGGGAYVNGSPVFRNCRFENNTVTGSGGGLYIETGAVQVIDCVFLANNADIDGGGIRVDDGSPVMAVTTSFVMNTSGMAGGALSCDGVAIACEFRENTGGAWVGVVVTTVASRFISNERSAIDATVISAVDSLFIENTSINDGGAIRQTSSGSLEILSCTFGDNSSDGSGGAVSISGGAAVIANSVLWGNTASVDMQISNATPMTTDIRHCDIEGSGGSGGGWDTGLGNDGDGNIDADPLFIDAAGGDYRINPASPCIDAGNVPDVPADTYDIDGNGNTTEELPLDLYGGARRTDNPQAPDCPQAPGMCGPAPIIDIGAHEQGGESIWDAPGTSGSFFNPGNWLQGVVPGRTDTVVLADMPEFYTVQIDTQNAVTDRLRVLDGTVTMQFGDFDYTLLGVLEPAQPSLQIASDNDVASLILEYVGVLGEPHGLFAQSVSLGDGTPSSGELVVDGTNTVFQSDGDFFIGRRGSGQLKVVNGGTASSLGDILVGDEPGSDGRVELNGVGSTWTVDGDSFFLGVNGEAQLEILNGAQLITNTAQSPLLGLNPGSSADVRISVGSWTETNAAAQLDVGVDGDATIAVESGGTLDINEIRLFASGELTGNATVQGDVISAGVVRPGLFGMTPQLGTLTIDGNYQQQAIVLGDSTRAGQACFRLGGTTSMPQFDQLTVTGTTSLGGGLFIENPGGLDPDSGLPPASLVTSSMGITGRYDVAFTPGLTGGRYLKLDYGTTGGVAGAGGTVTIEIADLQDLIDVDPTSNTLGAGTVDALLGDFNNDGFPDLAVAIDNGTGMPGVVVVALNAGTSMGQWDNFDTSAVFTFMTDPEPTAIASGLLDGDPDNLDLVVTTRGGGSDLLRVLGGQGDGTFLPLAPVDTGGVGPVDVATGDFDFLAGNGDAVEIAVANTVDGSIVIFSNDGSGVMTASQTIMLDPGISRIDPDDYDDDDCLDLTAANEMLDTATVLMNNQGTLGVLTEIDVDDAPVDIIGADLDGSGILDIVTVNNLGNSVSVIISTGPRTYAPAVNLPVGAQPESVAIIDLDLDGDMDIAFIADDDMGMPVVQVLRNDQNGGPQLTFATAESFNVGVGPVIVLAGDVNADNSEDLITVNDGAGVMAANTPATGGVAGGSGSVNALLNLLKPVPPCVGDANGSGVVDVTDLLAVILCWGGDGVDCPNPGESADVNADDTVNVQDLLDVILNWGACP